MQWHTGQWSYCIALIGIFTGDNIAFLYPDFSTALVRHFNETMLPFTFKNCLQREIQVCEHNWDKIISIIITFCKRLVSSIKVNWFGAKRQDWKDCRAGFVIFSINITFIVISFIIIFFIIISSIIIFSITMAIFLIKLLAVLTFVFKARPPHTRVVNLERFQQVIFSSSSPGFLPVLSSFWRFFHTPGSAFSLPEHPLLPDPLDSRNVEVCNCDTS